MRERRVIGSAVLTVEGAALALGDRLPSFGGPPITVRDMVHAGDFAANRPIETGWGLRQGHRELQGLSIYSGKEFIDRKTGGRLSGTLQIVRVTAKAHAAAMLLIASPVPANAEG